MALIANNVKMYAIGHQRYRYNGREGFYLQCVEDYPESEDQFGSSVQSIPTPYAESDKFKGVPMGLFEPAIIEFVPAIINRGGNSVLTAEKIVSITPYSQWFKSPVLPPSNQSKDISNKDK